MQDVQQFNVLYKDILKCLNRYASIQGKATNINGFPVTSVDLQILEALQSNRERQANMATIAHELGIATSTFTKSVAKLTNVGFTHKFRKQGNQKDVVVTLSDKGETFFVGVSASTTDWIRELSALMEEKPERFQYYQELLHLFIGWMDASFESKEPEVSEHILIPIADK